MRWRDVPPYVAAQIAGAIAGTAVANVMFGLPAFFPSHRVRAGGPLWLGEFVATFGLLAVIGDAFASRTGSFRLRSRVHRRRVLVYVVHVVRAIRP